MRSARVGIAHPSGAPPDPRVVVMRLIRPMRPCSVIGMSTRIGPFTVPVSSRAE